MVSHGFSSEKSWMDLMFQHCDWPMKSSDSPARRDLCLTRWGGGFSHSYFSQYTSLGNQNGAQCLCEQEIRMLKPQFTAATLSWVLSVVFVSMNVVERMCASACMCKGEYVLRMAVEACFRACLCATRRPRGNVYLFLLFSRTDVEITVDSQAIVHTWRRCTASVCLCVFWHKITVLRPKCFCTLNHTPHPNIHTATHCSGKGHWNCTLTHQQVQRKCFERNRKWTVGHGAEWV